jgi:hypothetical protein
MSRKNINYFKKDKISILVFYQLNKYYKEIKTLYEIFTHFRVKMFIG